jgi:HlyD family secretion protein
MTIEGLLPVSASGTLQIGQKAIIEIENYPSAQFGTLAGIVQDISLIPQDQKYRVKVRLPDGLKTSYQKVLPPSALLSAKVTIVTKEYSLLERLFQNIVDIMRNTNG